MRWVTEGPRSTDFDLHAGYCVGPDFVYVQALRGGGWRAFVAAPDLKLDAVNEGDRTPLNEPVARPRLGGRRRDL